MRIAHPLLLLAFAYLLDKAETQVSRKVTNTVELRDALRDPSVANIQIENSIAISYEEWGSAVPQIDRQVTVTAPESQQTLRTAIYFGERDDIIAIGPEGKLAFEGLRLPNVIDTRGDAFIHLITPIHVSEGGVIAIKSCNLTISSSLCAEVPFRSTLTLMDIWLITYPRVDSCGAQHHTERSIFLTGSKNCSLPTLGMTKKRGKRAGVVTAENVSVSCPDTNAQPHGETEHITAEVETAVDMAYTLVKAHDYKKAIVTIQVMNDIILDKQAWPHAIGTLSHHVLEIVIQGVPESRPTLIAPESNEGPIILLGTNEAMTMKDVILNLPKLSYQPYGYRRCNDDQVEANLEVSVLRPSIMFDHPSDLTIRNTMAIYEKCPDFFSPPNFCDRLQKYFQEAPNATATALDVTCSPEDPHTVVFNNIEATIPHHVDRGWIYNLWSFKATNYIVSCKEFGLDMSCSNDPDGGNSTLGTGPIYLEKEGNDTSRGISKNGLKWVLMVFVAVIALSTTIS